MGGDDVSGNRAAVFAVAWGLAALFHLAGNPPPPFAEAGVLSIAVQLGVGVAAVLVLALPCRRAPLVVLCALIPVSAWVEAPFVGNHWVLAAAISITYLLATAIVALRSGPWDAAGVWAAFAPVARIVLLTMYSFAAFAKLNTDFFDPAVSCAVFYQDQLVRSWGLGSLSVMGEPRLGVLVAVAAAAVELSVPVLLLVPRTRRMGLLLALTFHWSLALDLAQHFWDFSSVLFAAFLLFLDDEQVRALTSIVTRLRSDTRPAIRLLVTAFAATGLAPVLAATGAPQVVAARVLAVLAGHAAWVVIGTAGLLVVHVATLRTRRVCGDSALTPVTPLLLIVPVLVTVNGLTPYLEVKTGFGWNMYSNLRTVAGETNHLLVPATLDVSGLQSDRVEVVATSDSALSPLVGSEYEVVYSEFVEYVHDHAEHAVTYRRAGQLHEVGEGEGLPESSSVSELSRRLQSFRLVDVSGKERCQAVYTPAR